MRGWALILSTLNYIFGRDETIDTYLLLTGNNYIAFNSAFWLLGVGNEIGGDVAKQKLGDDGSRPATTMDYFTKYSNSFNRLILKSSETNFSGGSSFELFPGSGGGTTR